MTDPKIGSPGEFYPEFYEIEDSSSDDFKKAMQIYAASFPEAEVRPEASIENALRNGKIRMIACRIGDSVGMMASLFPIDGTPFLLVDYLATSQEFRGRGIGSLFLKKAFELIDGPKFDYLLVEVDDPGQGLDETKVRRIDFYRRHGMKELKGVRYLLPPMQGNKPTEMRLMVFPKCDADGPGKDKPDRDRRDSDSLAGCEIKEVLTRIFQELYHRGREDEFLASILEGIPDRISLV